MDKIKTSSWLSNKQKKKEYFVGSTWHVALFPAHFPTPSLCKPRQACIPPASRRRHAQVPTRSPRIVLSSLLWGRSKVQAQCLHPESRISESACSIQESRREGGATRPGTFHTRLPTCVHKFSALSPSCTSFSSPPPFGRRLVYPYYRHHFLFPRSPTPPCPSAYLQPPANFTQSSRRQPVFTTNQPPTHPT